MCITGVTPARNTTAIQRPMSGRMPSTTLNPLTTFTGDRLIGVVVAIELAIGTMFIFLVFRRALGRVGGLALFLLLVAASAISQPEIAIFQIVLLLTVLRFGLLAGAAMGLTVSLMRIVDGLEKVVWDEKAREAKISNTRTKQIRIRGASETPIDAN